MMSKRRIAAAAGAALLIVGVVAGREKPALDLVQERAPKAAAADDGFDISRLQRGEASVPQNDPFKSLSNVRVAAAAPAAPEKPVAPALPFRYFGKLTEKGKTEVFVMRGDELISLSQGQSLGEYRVDQVSESRISFTYLPLKTKQTLELQ